MWVEALVRLGVPRTAAGRGLCSRKAAGLGLGALVPLRGLPHTSETGAQPGPTQPERQLSAPHKFPEKPPFDNYVKKDLEGGVNAGSIQPVWCLRLFLHFSITLKKISKAYL